MSNEIKAIKERLKEINRDFDTLTASLITNEGCSSEVHRQILEQKSKYFKLWLDM